MTNPPTASTTEWETHVDTVGKGLGFILLVDDAMDEYRLACEALDSLRTKLERYRELEEAAKRLDEADCEWCDGECGHLEDEHGQLNAALNQLNQENRE